LDEIETKIASNKRIGPYMTVLEPCLGVFISSGSAAGIPGETGGYDVICA